jgi:hypothetical protein
VLGAAACSPYESDEHAVEAEVATTPAALTTAAVVDLLSPSTCVLSNGKLRQCAIAPRTVPLPVIDTAVPLRTVVRRVVSGTCSTPYPLAVSLRVDSEPEATLRFLSEPQLILRRADGDRATSLSLRDGTTWTAFTIVDGSCRVSLEVDANEVDIDTRQQAEAALARIDLDLVDARERQRTYDALLALQAAYTFTRAVAASFHAELTNDTMQALRQAAIDAAPALEVAALGCGGEADGEPSAALIDLYVSMVALGDPASWRNPNGTTRTLADFYGAGAAAVLARIEELAAQANPDLETEYRNELTQAAADVARLEQQRSLAQTQLAPWLGGTP